mgnify:CR=1 FL=1
MTSTDKMPTTKVAAGGAVGFITALLMWAITASGVSVPDAVLAGIPWLAGVIAAYLTPDKLVEYGRILRDSEGAHQGRHADNGNGIPDDAGDHLQIIPLDQATSDTKSDAAGTL